MDMIFSLINYISVFFNIVNVKIITKMRFEVGCFMFNALFGRKICHITNYRVSITKAAKNLILSTNWFMQNLKKKSGKRMKNSAPNMQALCI